jgi:hypothetical protein
MKNNYIMFIFSAMALLLCSFHSPNTVKPKMVMVEGGTFKIFPTDVKSKTGCAVTISSSAFLLHDKSNKAKRNETTIFGKDFRA